METACPQLNRYMLIDNCNYPRTLRHSNALIDTAPTLLLARLLVLSIRDLQGDERIYYHAAQIGSKKIGIINSNDFKSLRRNSILRCERGGERRDS